MNYTRPDRWTRQERSMSPEVSPTRLEHTDYRSHAMQPFLHHTTVSPRPQPAPAVPPSTKVQPAHAGVPQLTYANVLDMLREAKIDAAERYVSTLYLLEILQLNYDGCVDDCRAKERGPVDILRSCALNERRLFVSYNIHRMGGLENKLSPDIEEDLESFPFRCAVVTNGFPSLTEDLIPIFQSTEHAKVIDMQYQNPSASSKLLHPAVGKVKTDKNNYNKLQGAPPANLEFPTGNFTIPEIAAFHPEAIKSWDMIDRFCANGGSSAVYTAMINHYRIMPRGQVTNNSVYRMMKGPMQKRENVDEKFKDWTVGIHNHIEGLEEVDPESISVTGFRTPMEGKNPCVASPIPIRDFANGVKTFPTGHDALDLTRAVQYCQNHPNEQWMYPTDYERLIDLIGPAAVKRAHLDGAAFARYTTTKLAAGVKNSVGRKRDGRGRLQKEDSHEDEYPDTESDDESDSDIDFNAMDQRGSKRKTFLDESDESDEGNESRKTSGKRPKLAPKSHGTARRFNKHSMLRQEVLSDDDIDSESDSELYQGPKKMKKFAEVRRSGRATKVTQSYLVHPDDVMDDEEERDQ
ncbi:hypothetical protein HBH56_211240 [Parastagonospora nodorum]|uniref:Uncharacterized protein n=2 Tax=Phaeosphaeria nodorum (strain SN15 / ATCC MYA-4574 / FGSC 10173) TaxID=321614 RepID=A0A7U2I9Z0_PHANO|nr:hypothetical protein HBH56_211240 [Parastagonospora nodorum]QRD05988.1 hypothetical protein JI435_134070 [Parastagonospora nodorum SN15]KAH3931402.1 hypothetical protein HBH54_099850 [Parastagonospora nodorum]KAH3944268.1 hypothetical protein HBH53_161330 [Parastagonospora nodorum]KAH3960745.1 hypothetical protein HBH51_189540 [Parastagonospora nodorum]